MAILDTPEQIEMFRLLQLKHMLALEIRSGLTHSRGSIMNAVSDLLIRHGKIDRRYKRKQAAYDALCEYIEDRKKELFPDDKD